MKCSRCSWCQEEVICAPFDGNPEAEFIFAGEAYGTTEAKEGRPFCGDAGKKFDILLKLAQLKREEIAILNVIRGYKKGNPTPSKKELDSCFIFTQRDINKINPKLVIAMGASACYSLTGKKFSDCVGKLLFSDKIKKRVFTVYHPAASMYDPKKWGITVEHFKKIPLLISAKVFEPKHYDYIFIDTVEKFDKYISLIENSPSLYLDTEGTGLNPYKDITTLLQLGTEEHILLIDRKVIQERVAYLKNLIESKGITGAGKEYDHKFLHTNFGIDIEHYEWDVVSAEYILTGMKDNDLSFLSKKYVPESAGYDDAVKELGGAQNVRDQKQLLQYASDDVGVMPSIKKKQYKQLAQNDQLWLYENLTLPTNKILTEMSLRGVLYDIDKVKEVDEKYKIKAEKLLFQAQNLDGVKETEKHFRRRFNPKSSQMVKWMLIDYYKLPIIATTDKDNPSVGATEMKKYAEEFNNPYCNLMEKYRSYEHLRDSFLSGVLPKLVDGVAHTKYSVHATANGRPNSTDPNLLNIPRLDDVKKCIVARKGHKFVHADESQLEVRLASVIYDEPRLIEICNDFTKDPHSSVTAKAFNKSYDYIYNGYINGDKEITELRVAGKSIQFGVIYQEGAKKLAYTLGITVEKAQEFIDQYYKGFPDLRKNIDKIIEFVIEHGYIRNYFGFVRTWKYHSAEDHSTQREAVNMPIQSLAWNMLQLAMIQIDKTLKERKLIARLVLQVYDSVVVETPDEEIPEVTSIVKEIMESVIIPWKNINRVKLKSDVEVGENLSELEKYNI